MIWLIVFNRIQEYFTYLMVAAIIGLESGQGPGDTVNNWQVVADLPASAALVELSVF